MEIVPQIEDKLREIKGNKTGPPDSTRYLKQNSNGNSTHILGEDVIKLREQPSVEYVYDEAS